MERLAIRLHPHRIALLTAGLACFLCAALPVAAAARGALEWTPWLGVFFAALAPLALWAIDLALLPSLFHPREGVLADLARDTHHPWLSGLLRGYATLTVAAFAAAPPLVWVAAAA